MAAFMYADLGGEKCVFIFITRAGIAIGGDVFPGSTLSDHVLRFNNIPQVSYIIKFTWGLLAGWSCLNKAT